MTVNSQDREAFRALHSSHPHHPAHKEYVLYTSYTVQEVDFDQVDCSKKNWNHRSLCALRDIINVYFARQLPTSRRGRFADKSVPIHSIGDFEQRTVTPVKSRQSEIMIYVLVKLLLNHPYQALYMDWMSVVLCSSVWSSTLGQQESNAPSCSRLKKHHCMH
ncbi:hypothetical protein BDW60DRAFT_195638, partial [Aspergillus nidulans var. acristatus]